jgi:hypothetical protein
MDNVQKLNNYNKQFPLIRGNLILIFTLHANSRNHRNVTINIGFGDLTEAVWKSSAFWEVTPCIPLKTCPRFGEACRLHLQDGRISQARD